MFTKNQVREIRPDRVIFSAKCYDGQTTARQCLYEYMILGLLCALSDRQFSICNTDAYKPISSVRGCNKCDFLCLHRVKQVPKMRMIPSTH